MADMMSAKSLQVLEQNAKEMIIAEGGDRLAVLNRSERLAEEKERGITLLRRKIEVQNDKVLGARQRFFAARKVLEAAEKRLQAEEAFKAELCRDLSELVAQSADQQLLRLEALTQRLMALNSNMGGDEAADADPGQGPAPKAPAGPPATDPSPGPPSQAPLPESGSAACTNPFVSGPDAGAATNPFLSNGSAAAPGNPDLNPAAKACAAAAREAAAAPAAEARGRHVAIGGPRRGGPSMASSRAAPVAPARPRAQPVAAAATSRFQGFDA
ncbi:hypothetical protein WJX81_003334 [Elliptochloris bilobata]|uniref:RAB6-interacting golgin n=1 Tax=Elliptochloris bilobata TaxID=381761 RepID=A0AAW1RJK6_9CHLO